MNQVNQHDWPKGTRKKYPIKVIQTITRAQLRDTPFKFACVPIHTYCTLLSLNKYFTCFVTFCLVCKAEGPGPLSLATDLVVRNWCFHCRNPAQSLTGNLSPAPWHCRSRPPEIGVATAGNSEQTYHPQKFPRGQFFRKGAACRAEQDGGWPRFRSRKGKLGLKGSRWGCTLGLERGA